MDVMYYILSPFSWLLNFFYSFSDSYGISIMLFALVVKVILFPLNLKGKRGMIQMNMLSGRMQQLQKQYGKDRERYNLEVQRLYEREKVNPMSGCLWSFLPLLILLPLYAIIREPLHYMMGLTADQIATVAQTLNWSGVAFENGWVSEAGAAYANSGYNQLFLASLLTPDTVAAVQAALGEGVEVFAMNFRFLGLDLAMLPTWKVWENPSWEVIGALLLIVLSAGSSVVMSKISMRTNQISRQTANEQVERTNRMMLWMMPLMSLWIGFFMPVAMCVYWIANSLLSMVQEVIAGRLLKKDYEQARAAAEERERQEKEEEKRRKEEARLERARRLEEEKKNRGRKKPAQKKETAPGVDKDASREGMRAYARGRAYDPNRFGGVTPYRDPNGAPAPVQQEEHPAPAEEETQAPESAALTQGEQTAPVQEAAAEESAAPEEEAGAPDGGEEDADAPDQEDESQSDEEDQDEKKEGV